MARKTFEVPNPDEVEKLFSTVDDTGHSNEEKAKKQRLFRKERGIPREVDPLRETNPAGENVEKLIRTTALIFVVATLAVVVIAQVSCGLARRAVTANLSTDVSYDSVYRALEGGVEWGDGFTQFPDDFKVIEANERTHRVEVSVVNTSTDSEMDCFAASNIQSTAFAVNALLNPDIDTVVFHVDVHQSDKGLPEKSALFGFLKPTGTVKRFMTFVWSKHATENGVNFTSSITGADPALMDKLQKQLNMTLTENIFGVAEDREANLYRYKTDKLSENAKVGKIVSQIKYPEGASYDSVKINNEDSEVVVFLTIADAKINLDRQAILTMALIGDVDKIVYCDAKTKDELVAYTRDDLSKQLEDQKTSFEEITKSQSAFTDFVNEKKN